MMYSYTAMLIIRALSIFAAQWSLVSAFVPPSCSTGGRLPFSNKQQQQQQRQISSTRDLFLLADGDFATLDAYISNNAAVSADTSSSSSWVLTTGVDPILVVAGCFGAVALIGLVVLQFSDDAKPTPPPSSTTATSSTSGISDVKQISSSTTSESEGNNPSQSAEIVSTETAIDSSDEEEITAIEEKVAKKVVMKVKRDGISDDLSLEENSAVQAFENEDRVGLLSSLGRLTGLARSTRAELKQERNKRETAEQQLAGAAEEMRELEDQYELGQNKLTSTTKELISTRSNLAETERELTATSSEMKILQEERKSLRKLGKAAWQLSRRRVQNRVQKLRRRDNGKDGE